MATITLSRRRPPGAPDADRYAGRAWRVRCLAIDLIMLSVAVTMAIALEPRGALPGSAWLLGVALAAGTLASLAGRGAYSSRLARHSAFDTARDVLSAHATGAAVTIAAAALVAPDRATTTALVAAAALGAVLVALGRGGLLLLRHRARAAGRSGQPTLIVGAGWVGAELERRMLASPGMGMRPVGFLDENPSPAFRDAGPTGRVLGTPRELAAVAERTGARHVIVAFSAIRDADVLPVVRAAQALDLDISVVPRMFEDVSIHQQIDHVGGMALCRLQTPNPRAWPLAFAVKHAFGRTVALGVTLVAAPVLVACAVGVRLSSPGPVLFRQLRVGRDGQVFEILKFRTMRLAEPVAPGAERDLLAVGSGPGGVEGDDRRTRIGTFLRRSSLDELPQLFNVVVGHMSLVGPRPERPEFVALFSEDIRGYDDRHRVKSGMTGWAQVNGLRGQTSIAERIELDNWYVANWSLWLDLRILMLTPLEVLRSRAEAAAAAPPTPAEAQAVLQAEQGRLLHQASSRG